MQRRPNFWGQSFPYSDGPVLGQACRAVSARGWQTAPNIQPSKKHEEVQEGKRPNFGLELSAPGCSQKVVFTKMRVCFSFWYFLNVMDLWTSETILVSTLSKPQVHNINVYNQATNPKQTKCWGLFSLSDAGPTASTFWDVEPTYECYFKKFIVWRSTF